MVLSPYPLALVSDARRRTDGMQFTPAAKRGRTPHLAADVIGRARPARVTVDRCVRARRACPNSDAKRSPPCGESGLDMVGARQPIGVVPWATKRMKASSPIAAWTRFASPTVRHLVGTNLSAGDGYLMVASDGGIFTFSNKPFFGSFGDTPPPNPIVDVAARR